MLLVEGGWLGRRHDRSIEIDPSGLKETGLEEKSGWTVTDGTQVLGWDGHEVFQTALL